MDFVALAQFMTDGFWDPIIALGVIVGIFGLVYTWSAVAEKKLVGK